MYVCASYHIWVSAAVPLGLERGVEKWGFWHGVEGSIGCLKSVFQTRFTEQFDKGLHLREQSGGWAQFSRSWANCGDDEQIERVFMRGSANRPPLECSRLGSRRVCVQWQDGRCGELLSLWAIREGSNERPDSLLLFLVQGYMLIQTDGQTGVDRHSERTTEAVFKSLCSAHHTYFKY